MQHESLSNSPTYGNGSFSPKLKNIWAYQPIALEDAAALTMNSHFLRHNYSNYRNTAAGFKQQHSSNHDRNSFMHKHCVHHQKQHHNLHHLQQHYQYKQQTTSSQLPQLFLTQLERRCQNVSVNSNAGAFKENFERQKHEERSYVAEECSGANDKLHNTKEPLLDLKLSPEDLTTIATTRTPTPTPKTALMLPTTTTDRNSPLSTVTDYITLRHPTDYGTDFQ